MEGITINGISLTSYGYERLKNDIKSQHETIAKALLHPDGKGKGKGYVCPVCDSGSGHGGKSTGISCKDNGVYRCWAGGCITTNGKQGGDIFKVIGLVKNTTDYMEQLKEAIRILGIDVTHYEQKGAERMQAKIQLPPQQATQENTTPEADYTEQYKVWADNLKNSTEAQAYLAARGILFEDLPTFDPPLGFCPNWRSPKAVAEGKKPPTTKRLIIPTGKGHYLARDITGQVEKAFAKMHTGKKEAFGLSMLNDIKAGEMVFITEGEFDALSFIANGYKAIALGGATEAEAIAEQLKGKPCTFLIAGDNDTAGAKATATLIAKLNEDTIKAYDVTQAICQGGEKDPNEVLSADIAEFKRRAKQATLPIQRPNSAKLFLETKFNEEAERLQDAAGRFTGIYTLDRQQKALYSGLYVVFAISSLGKTTLVHQMADNMARSGQEVLFFSLEMSTHEMICKSINRELHKASPHNQATSLAIRRGLNTDDIQRAKATYIETTAERINIIEGDFNYSVEDLIKEIQAHIERTGKKPVVFIDYLQLLKPIADKRQTTKEVMDNAVTNLKQIARKYNITIIAISSINRANYMTEVSFEAIKESGGIEYTADVIWGLQLEAVHDLPKGKDGKLNLIEARQKLRIAKNEDPRKIELVCLKNRYGISSYQVDLLYYPKKDLFIDPEEEQQSKGSR